MRRKMAASTENKRQKVLLTIEVDVTDEEALRRFAADRYSKAWPGAELDPETDLPQVVLEALVLSNDNPAPADYGIELNDYEAADIPEE